MAKNKLGKHYRSGMTIREMVRAFDDERDAEEFVINARWGDDVRCPRCGTDNIRRNDKAKASSRFLCRPCRRYFSAKTGTAMHSSKISLSDWLVGIYQFVTHLPGESSMKLHRDLGLTQPCSWHMGHRIRSGLKGDIPEKFEVPVQMDESHVGGKAKTMSKKRYKKIKDMGLLGGGARHMSHVAGMKDRKTGMVRAEVVLDTKSTTLQDFVTDHTYEDTQVYKGGIRGTYRNVSPKHLQRYVDEYVGKHNLRPLDTLVQMAEVIRGMEGKQVKYEDLVAYTGENRYTVIKE